jgi:hypothetical protein
MNWKRRNELIGTGVGITTICPDGCSVDGRHKRGNASDSDASTTLVRCLKKELIMKRKKWSLTFQDFLEFSLISHRLPQ